MYCVNILYILCKYTLCNIYNVTRSSYYNQLSNLKELKLSHHNRYILFVFHPGDGVMTRPLCLG